MKAAFVWSLRIALGAAAVLLAVRLVRPDQRLTVTVLSVGQGDAILVQCGHDQLLVDGGPDDIVLTRLGETMPFFDRTIENVVITHPHGDHYFGLIGTFARYHVDHLTTSGFDSAAPDYRALMDESDAAGTEKSAATPGERIAIGNCGTAEVLWPDRSRTDIIGSDPNAESVVLRVTRNDATSPRAAVILTGDATDEDEHALIESRAPLGADVLKVGHHGSRTSSSPAFLAAVHPVQAVISLATINKYGHPSPITLLRLKSVGAEVFRTDQDGNVRVVVLPDRAYVER